MKKLHSLLKKYKYHVIVFFTARYDIREYILQIVIALCIGAIAGLGAMVFHTLIEWMRIAINPKHFADYLEIPSIIIVIIPVIGGLITIGMYHTICNASKRTYSNCYYIISSGCFCCDIRHRRPIRS